MHFDKKGNVEHLKWLSLKYCFYLSDFLAAIHSSLFYLGRIFLFLIPHHDISLVFVDFLC